MKKILTFLLLTAVWLEAAELKIVATSDLHGNLPALSALAPAIRRAGADALKLDNGDLVMGNFYAEYSGGMQMIEALNELHFDALVPGNHDFELNFSDYRTMTGKFKGKVLGGDWRWHDLGGQNFQLFTRNGVRCAVIGLTEPKMGRRCYPGSGMNFADQEQILEQTLETLRRQKRCDVIVLLWHCGLEGPYGIAQKLRRFPQIDLVIAGHTHQACPGKLIGRTYAVQPGAHGANAAEITVTVDDKTRKITRISSKLLVPEFRHPDPVLKGIQKKYGSLLYPAAYQRVTKKPEQLNLLSRFGAAALAENGHTRGALFVYTPQEFRPKNGNMIELYKLLPYRNRLCTVELTRSELKTLCSECFFYAEKYKRHISISGFTAHGGKRGLTRFKAPERIKLTVSTFTLTGTKALRPLLEEKTPRFHILDMLERDAVADYLRKHTL